MKTKIKLLAAMLLLSTINNTLSTVHAQGTAFTYQGRLNTNGSPANGSYDLFFSLYTVSGGGSVAAGPLTNSATGVTNGLFTVTLDFGPGVFNGTAYWLDISARTNGSGTFTPLKPRQPLSPTPYSIYAENSGGVTNGSISAPQLNTVGAPVSGQVLEFNGTSLQWTTPSGGSSGWSLTGNDGSGDILGTTNNHPLYLVANSLNAGTFWPFPNGSVSVALGAQNYFSTSGQGGNFLAGGGNSSYPNVIFTDNSSIGGGYGNRIDQYSPASVIAGGAYQRIWSGSSSVVIGGGLYNTISNNASGGVIPGGQNNLVAGACGFAAGFGAQALNPGAFVWADNSAGGAPFASTSNNQFSVRALGGVRFVTGGAGMTIDGVLVSGGGGGSNANLTISMIQTTNSGLDSSAIGYQNTASGNYATVAGGWGNTASGVGAFVGGGGYDGYSVGGNTAQFPAATVVGGLGNNAANSYATVVGGYNNVAGNVFSLVGGGVNNAAGGEAAFVGAGLNNNASGLAATIPGGSQNLASGNYSFAAGSYAQAVNLGAFVWADTQGTPFASTADNQFSVRAANGVRIVTQNNSRNLTVDGYRVLTTYDGSGSGGGSTNGWLLTGNSGANPANGYFLGTIDTNALELRVDGLRALRLEPGTVANYPNVIGGSSVNSVVSGADAATIGGGYNNQISANYAAIGGGQGNRANGVGATVSGGLGNTANNYAGGTVGGGSGNTAGNYGTVPGGYNNIATGNGSFAAGRDAVTTYDGTFVWSDGTQTFNGSGANQFDVLATGGMSFDTSTMSILALNGVFIDTDVNANNGIGLNLAGKFLLVTGAGGESAYLGGDGVGNDVQIGSLNSNVTSVACYNAASGSYMHLDCSSISIKGGADLAEPFQFSGADKDMPQGAVVVIDKKNPGQLKMSDQPYDRHVAGVVSGANGINPGIQMQQQGLLEGGRNVALTGRVYVLADASNEPIEPGDLLTTSSAPGHAMKVTDNAMAQGAILGKAMTGLSKGKGMVLVLVTLQ